MSNKKSWWWRLWHGPEKKNTPKTQSDLEPTEPYVFVTVSGKKFHYDADCTYLQNAWANNKVIKMGVSKAKKSGRKACDKCCWGYLHD
jgi:hypothetical protein